MFQLLVIDFCQIIFYVFDHVFDLCVYGISFSSYILTHWFTNVSMCKNPLKDLLRH